MDLDLPPNPEAEASRKRMSKEAQDRVHMSRKKRARPKSFKTKEVELDVDLKDAESMPQERVVDVVVEPDDLEAPPTMDDKSMGTEDSVVIEHDAPPVAMEEIEDSKTQGPPKSTPMSTTVSSTGITLESVPQVTDEGDPVIVTSQDIHRTLTSMETRLKDMYDQMEVMTNTLNTRPQFYNAPIGGTTESKNPQESKKVAYNNKYASFLQGKVIHHPIPSNYI